MSETPVSEVARDLARFLASGRLPRRARHVPKGREGGATKPRFLGRFLRNQDGAIAAVSAVSLVVILGFGRALKQRLSRLVKADERHYQEKAVYSALLKKRDSLTRELTQLVVALRRIVLGEHVQPDLDQLGFEGETAREPVPVLRQADRIVEIFAKGDLESGDVAKLDAARQQLEQELHTVAEVLYKSQAADGADPTAGPEAAGAGGADDDGDVVDAEYTEEVKDD